MASWTIYHDPRSPQSREALQLLRDNGVEPKVIEYLKAVPTERELEMLLMKLGMKAEDLLRKKEPGFKRKYGAFKFNEHEWVRLMHQHPTLIDRPIVVKGHKAGLGRPLDKIEELL